MLSKMRDDLLRVRLTRRTFVGGVLGSALLAACGGDDDEDNTPAPAATSTQAPAAEPTATTAAPAATTAPDATSAPDATTPPGSDASPTAAPASTPTEIPTTAPATDAELIVGHHLDPTTLNPLDTTTAAFQSVYAHIVEQLIIFDTETVGVAPWLCEAWEWVDAVTLEMRLREGVSFTNGEPFNAEAAKFSIDQLAAAAPYAIFMPRDVYNNTEVIDEHTVQVHLNSPYAPILGLFARGSAVVPPQYYTEAEVAGYGQEPIGTGPFVLSEWVKDDHITLTRNEDYWRGPHPIATVTYRVIPEDTARIAALEVGEIHIALNVPVSAASRLQGNDDIDTIVYPGLRKFATHFDTKSGDTPALADPIVRRALNHAVDKQAIVDSLFQGAAAPLQGQWLVESEFGFNPNISMFEYDPDLARQMLAEAGFPDGFDLQLSYTVGRYALDKEMGEIVSSYLEQVGVRVNQRALEYGTFSQNRTDGTIGTHQWGLLLPPDPHFNYMLFVTDSSYETHPLGDEYQQLVAEGSEETDLAAREAIYHRIGEIVNEDPPMLYLIVTSDIYGVSKDVIGFVPRTDQVLWLFDVSMAT